MNINRDNIKSSIFKKNDIKTFNFLSEYGGVGFLTPKLTFLNTYLKIPKNYNFSIIIKRLYELKAPLLSDFENIHIIYVISKYYNKRINDISDFKKFKTKNKSKQIYELIDFLYVKYNVPMFLKQLLGEHTPHIEYIDPNIELFFFLTNGNNIRKWKDLPFPLTKKEAHSFMRAPNNCSPSVIYIKIKIGNGGSFNLKNIIHTITVWCKCIWYK